MSFAFQPPPARAPLHFPSTPCRCHCCQPPPSLSQPWGQPVRRLMELNETGGVEASESALPVTVLMGRENVDGVVYAAPPGFQATQSPNRSKGVASDQPRAEPHHTSSSAAMLKRVIPLRVRALNPLSFCQTPSESTAAKRLPDCGRVYCLLGK